jgi:hypothetical protein
MRNGEHVWAVAYDDMERANPVRDEIVRLGRDEEYLILIRSALAGAPSGPGA